ncbi:Na+/H+ antiporter family protein [Bacillus litorisediminis]|uniref:Na+/H+ antiporter family protein n=1 Tax=Bacillus litorisediminis TaxID=2922713 RepID=UPI001FAFACBB|nr:Na+/H+ antiporter family protein [Bacillus litorisediminis]
MNAVVISVIVMLLLSLLRIHVVVALAVGSLVGGLLGGLSLNETVQVFTDGLGDSASVALSYSLLGAFAFVIGKTGLPDLLIQSVIKLSSKKDEAQSKKKLKALVIILVLIMACFSQNVIPVHIAFIPILIPPLLKLFNELQIDRRLIANVLTFGLIAPYVLLPVGFGQIYQGIIVENMALSGLTVNPSDVPMAMMIPVIGLAAGLIISVFVSYRKPKIYQNVQEFLQAEAKINKQDIVFAILSVLIALAIQLYLDSMIFGALAGIATLYLSRTVKGKQGDEWLTQGMKMMAFIGFVMLSAYGFANVMRATGDVEALVDHAAVYIGNQQWLGALIMLLVGLLVTLGIGSSFSTVPIIATIFVPLCVELGFSPMATIALIGTAGALGDAGSPVSDSTLGPTAGLNADGQHNHIWDTVVPTFLHYNLPLIVFGWIAAMIL